METTQSIPKKKTLPREKKKLIFYTLMMIFPIMQFCVFYIFLNFTSLRLAFQKYDENMNFVYTFENFVTVFKFLPQNLGLIFNSLIFFVFNLTIGSLLALFFSYYIFKKYFFSELFRVVLFLPQIVSGMVLTLLFRYLATDFYTALTGNQGLLDNPTTRLATLIVYNLWLGFGTNILMYSGTMSNINESIIESASLDGVNSLQEFCYIVFPMVYSTFVTFTIVCISGIFTNDMRLYTLYAHNANSELQNIGYYIVDRAQQAIGDAGYYVTEGDKIVNFCQLASLGVVITAVLLPITFGIRKMMEKLGPKFE